MEVVDRMELTARLDSNPRYRGSSHDDEVARAMGFRAALIPGAFLYGHMTRLAVMEWGDAWLDRGWASVRFRRPVYNGDRMVIERGPWAHVGDRIEAEVRLTNLTDDVLAVTGRIGLPDQAPPLPEVLPHQPPRPTLPDAAGALSPGFRPASDRRRIESDEIRQSLADFDEDHPIYENGALAHSGFLVRQTMGDTLRSLSFPQPVIFVAAEVQNFTRVPSGSVVESSAVVADVYERNGRRYFDSDEVLLANGSPAARHIRVNLFG